MDESIDAASSEFASEASDDAATEQPKIDWKSRRIAPHWSLLAAALVLFAFLVDALRDHLSPLAMSVGILLLLYPSRRIRAIKPLLFLALLVSLLAIWWRLSSLLLPFLISFLLAYALSPTVEWFVRRGMPRLLVILVIALVVLGSMIGGGILIFPRLWLEVNHLAEVVPEWIEYIRDWGEGVLLPWLSAFNFPVESLWGEVKPRLPGLLQNVLRGVVDWSGEALSGVLDFAAGLFNLILIPVVTIYLLNDFPRLRRWIYGLFPENFKVDALAAYHGLNEAMSAYLRGQLLVSLFLALWIGGGLVLIAQLPYGLILGAAAGLFNLIPYVGTTAALILTLVVSFFQPDPVVTALTALAIFVTGQTIEGNFLTPRLVGDRVGLHPIVVIFIVLLFATLFGLIGMLVAIPTGAAARVLWDVWAARRRRIELNLS
ncbi:MAG: AI-2E family transporter [Calditrichaeota bacterium]|nr:AI-2E family transporter [Calditrichota bacterium]